MTEYAIKGTYRDRLFDPQGGEIFDSGWRSNLIVARCRILLGSFMHDDGKAKGIQALHVGQGDPLWDTIPPAPPDPSITQLVDTATLFIIPKASLVIQYLNDSDAIVANPTSRVQVVATLGPNQPAAPQPYKLREFGLFGQLDGAAFMIDYIRHPLIEKSGSVTLERRVRLIF